MINPTEKVINMPQFNQANDDNKAFIEVIYEIINMFFEMFISFIPVFIYLLTLYIGNQEIDYYKNIENGSILWIFLAMLVAGNFKLLTSSQIKRGIIQRLILACIIFFMLIMLGVYLILTLHTYNMLNFDLSRPNITRIVLCLGGSTVILNLLRIVFFTK